MNTLNFSGDVSSSTLESFKNLQQPCTVCGTLTNGIWSGTSPTCPTCKEFYGGCNNKHLLHLQQCVKTIENDNKSIQPSWGSTWQVPMGDDVAPSDSDSGAETKKNGKKPTSPQDKPDPGHSFLIKNLLPHLEPHCVICGRSQFTKRQGVNICNACYMFYYRARLDRRYLQFDCILWIHPDKGVDKQLHDAYKCSYCRFNRCLQAGLKRDF